MLDFLLHDLRGFQLLQMLGRRRGRGRSKFARQSKVADMYLLVTLRRALNIRLPKSKHMTLHSPNKIDKTTRSITKCKLPQAPPYHSPPQNRSENQYDGEKSTKWCPHICFTRHTSRSRTTFSVLSPETKGVGSSVRNINF